MNALELAHTIVGSLEAKKGEDILLLDLQNIASFTDYFVLCTGTSDRMLDALAESTLETVRDNASQAGHEEREKPARVGWSSTMVMSSSISSRRISGNTMILRIFGETGRYC